MTQEIVDLGAAWHYRLERRLARSSFGEIWHAVWLQNGKAVALKRLDRSVKQHPDLERLRVETLGREMAVYRCLGEGLHFARHLHDGEVDGCPVIVLELLDGDLNHWLDRKGLPLPPMEVLAWVRQLAVALDWMHRHGRCHLDLKPGNLLYRELGEGIPPVLKLADFGLALDCHDGLAEHQIPGSLGWMAPEQVFPESFTAGQMPVYRSDQRADVFVLGLLLYYLLTGKKTAFAQTTETLLRNDPEALHWIRPGDFSQYAFGNEECSQLSGAATGNTASMAAPPSRGTWIPGCRGRPEKKPDFEIPTPERASEQAVDKAAFFPLLQCLLVPDPNRRPGSATEVLAILDSIMAPGQHKSEVQQAAIRCDKE